MQINKVANFSGPITLLAFCPKGAFNGLEAYLRGERGKLQRRSAPMRYKRLGSVTRKNY